MTANISYALDAIAIIGAIAFGLGLLIVTASLAVKHHRADKGKRKVEPVVQPFAHGRIIDLMEALKASLTDPTATDPEPEPPAEGRMIYPKRRMANR